MQRPKKAIITAAGSGTRFLPATKAQPKEMLPIIDKPIIQYCAEEAVAGGAHDIIIVTKKTGHATEDHFDDNLELEQYLTSIGKTAALEAVQKSSSLANMIFVRQKASMPYGNATPLIVARDLVSDGPFYYMYGDDLTLAQTPVCEQLARVYDANPDAAAILAVYEVPIEEVEKYGVVKLKAGTDNVVESLVEKPKRDEAPSTLVVFGRMLCTPKILPYIDALKPGKANELWFTDALNALAQHETVLICKIEGKWLTTGDPLNHFKATVEFALDRDDLKDDIRTYLEARLKEK
jgi:UTP--glucose-1-phosphate uridylyltransferase